MLEITIPAVEAYDEVNNEFITVINEQTLRLEHSLVSLAKWESKWRKPFLSQKQRTLEETIDYVKCMTITQNVDPMVYQCLNNSHIKQINDYIENPMTATTFVKEQGGKSNGERVTAELIYYWMISLNIPVEFQKWHLNRLLTLIKVCSIKNQPPKKMSRNEILSRNAALNAQRRQQLNTKG
jgi:hypothetical protein